MSSGSDEIQARVNTEINFVDTAGLLLLQHIGLMLIIQELDDGHPRIAVVDIVSETWGINNSEADCGYVSIELVSIRHVPYP